MAWHDLLETSQAVFMQTAISVYACRGSMHLRLRRRLSTLTHVPPLADFPLRSKTVLPESCCPRTSEEVQSIIGWSKSLRAGHQQSLDQ